MSCALIWVKHNKLQIPISNAQIMTKILIPFPLGGMSMVRGGGKFIISLVRIYLEFGIWLLGFE
jgi:hypothetical protein